MKTARSLRDMRILFKLSEAQIASELTLHFKQSKNSASLYYGRQFNVEDIKLIENNQLGSPLSEIVPVYENIFKRFSIVVG